jgi:hypothetical protein
MPRCSHIVGASRSGARRHRGERLEPKHWNKPRCAGVVRLSSAAVAVGLLLVHVRHLRESLDYGNYATTAFVCRRRSGRWASEARVRHDARVRRPSRTGVARGRAVRADQWVDRGRRRRLTVEDRTDDGGLILCGAKGRMPFSPGDRGLKPAVALDELFTRASSRSGGVFVETDFVDLRCVARRMSLLRCHRSRHSLPSMRMTLGSRRWHRRAVQSIEDVPFAGGYDELNGYSWPYPAALQHGLPASYLSNRPWMKTFDGPTSTKRTLSIQWHHGILQALLPSSQLRR